MEFWSRDTNNMKKLLYFGKIKWGVRTPLNRETPLHRPLHTGCDCENTGTVKPEKESERDEDDDDKEK